MPAASTRHVRGEGAHLFRAVNEAIEIGRRTGVPAHVSHLKCETSYMWGRADELLALVHEADDVTGDQYPYGMGLRSLVPPPRVGTRGRAPALLADRATRDRLTESVEHGRATHSSRRSTGSAGTGS